MAVLRIFLGYYLIATWRRCAGGSARVRIDFRSIIVSGTR